MCYVYVLLSEKDKKFFTGFSEDVYRRFEQHNKGLVESTKYRRPFILVYFEASMNLQDALHREKYLKTTYGKRYIRNRLKNLLNESPM
jgi:putative endonuclease